MSALKGLEDPLNDVFVKSAPALPKGFKDFLVKIVPWLSLIVGVLSLLSVLSIYRWATRTSDLVDYANDLSRAYGGGDVVTNGWTAMLFVSLAVLAITAILYILAFSPLKNLKKQGWDYLFYALILNLVYGIVIAFTNYGTFGNIIWSLIGSAIGAYFLFQLRAYYIGKEKVAAAAPPPKATTEAKSKSDAKK